MEIFIPNNSSRSWAEGGLANLASSKSSAGPRTPSVKMSRPSLADHGFISLGGGFGVGGMLPSVHSILATAPSPRGPSRPSLHTGELSPATPQESRAPTPTHERPELPLPHSAKRPAFSKPGLEGRRPSNPSPVSSHAPSPAPSPTKEAVREGAAKVRAARGLEGGRDGAQERLRAIAGAVPAVRGDAMLMILAACAALDGLPFRPAPRHPAPDARPDWRGTRPGVGLFAGRVAGKRAAGSESESEEGDDEEEDEEDDEAVFRRGPRPRPRPAARRRVEAARGPGGEGGEGLRAEALVGMSGAALRRRMLEAREEELEGLTSKQLNKIIERLGGQNEAYRHLSKPVYIQKLKKLIESIRRQLRGEAPEEPASPLHPVDDDDEDEEDGGR